MDSVGGIMPGASVTQWNLTPGTGQEAAVVPGDGASLKRVNVPAGRRADRHSHPHEQFVLVVSGAGQLECEAGMVELRPGTVLRFAAGAWHSAEFTQDTVLVEVNLPEGAR